MTPHSFSLQTLNSSLSETCEEYCMSGVDQFPAQSFDTYERQLSESGDQRSDTAAR